MGKFVEFRRQALGKALYNFCYFYVGLKTYTIYFFKNNDQNYKIQKRGKTFL